MTATGKATRYPRSFGVPWVGEVPQQATHVGLSGTLQLNRDPLLEVAGIFAVQRGGHSAVICQVDWRVEGEGSNPVLPEHFKGGVLPSGQVFFAAGAVEVPVSFLLSPGAEPPPELTGRVVLENPVNCELAAGRGELPLSIAAAVITDDAVVALDVPFTILDPESGAVGSDRYVSPGGSDSAAGTFAAPWQTLGYAIGKLGPTSPTLYVRGGTYRTPVSITVSGTPAQPIVIQAYPGEVASLDGAIAAFQTVPNAAWTLHDSATETYASLTLAAGTWTGNLEVGGVRYALRQYNTLAGLMSTTYTYRSDGGYYSGPGFTYSGGRLYVRLQSLTGDRAADLGGRTWAIPSNHDPRQNVLNLSPVANLLTVNGHDITWRGISIVHADVAIVANAASFVTFEDCPRIVTGRNVLRPTNSAHDIHIVRCPDLDGGLPPWLSWTEVKADTQVQAALKSMLCSVDAGSYNIWIENCHIKRFFDGLVCTNVSNGIYLRHNDVDYVLDDFIQCGTANYNVEVSYNYGAMPVFGHHGNGALAAGRYGTKFVHHNIVLLANRDEFYARAAGPPIDTADEVNWRTSHYCFPHHSTDDDDPIKIYSNTILFGENQNNQGVLNRSGAGPGLMEVYNNIFMVPTADWRIVRDADVSTGAETWNGNLYYRGVAVPTDPLFFSMDPGGVSFMSLALLRANPTFAAFEPAGVEGNPLLPGGGDYRPGASGPAASGGLNLLAKGWPGVSSATHRGAVAPGASNPRGEVGP